MVKKQVIIIAIILIVAALGFLFFSNMTGNVITGAALNPEIKTEYFRIDDFGMEINEEEVKLDGTQNSGRSR
ncbi:hypothetical protein KAS08_02885 [Candidatus Pacearchaeota archaeon]|nr:hypothetical protein [Candidatus Pacearchaeota archaeon]